MLKTKCFIVGGMILCSSLQVKAFILASSTAACATVAAAAATVTVHNSASRAMANKECEQDKDKEPDIARTVSGFIALLCFSVLLFMRLLQLACLFLGKDNDI